MQGSARCLRTGLPPADAAAALLAPTVARLAAEHPRLAVHVAEVEPAEAFDLLLSGAADVSVVEATPDCPPYGDARFDQQPLLVEPMDLRVPEDHPFAAYPAVTLAEAATQAWIVGAQGTSYYQLTVVACTSAGFAPDIVHTVKEWVSVAALVSHGLGVALVPRLGRVPPEERVVRVPLRGDPAPSRRILTCVRRGSCDQPAIRHSLDVLRCVASTHEHETPGTPRSPGARRRDGTVRGA